MAKKKVEQQLEKLAIEMPLDGFTAEKMDNLSKLVDSKAPLIKKVLAVDELPINVLEDRVAFPWFAPDLPAEEIQAYSQFVAALCDTAKKKARIVARPAEQYENEKFTMRVFGIGLGLIGDDFAECRKLLSRNLSGDSSWRYTKPEKGAPRPRRESVHRDVISIRLTPNTLDKLAILAGQAPERTSRNMLIESVIEDYIRAAFPAPMDTPTPTETAPEGE